MNWTGGAGPRSRSLKPSLIAAQKRNFAKARGKILNTRQASLELDFSIFEPGARLIRTEPQSNHTTNLDRRCNSLLNQPREHVKSVSLSHTEQSEYSPIPSRRNDQLQHPGQKKRKPSTKPSLETMKRQLLMMDDWCGLKHTRPVKEDFVDAPGCDVVPESHTSTDTRHRRHNSSGKSSASVEQAVFDINSDEMLLQNECVASDTFLPVDRGQFSTNLDESQNIEETREGKGIESTHGIPKNKRSQTIHETQGTRPSHGKKQERLSLEKEEEEEEAEEGEEEEEEEEEEEKICRKFLLTDEYATDSDCTPSPRGTKRPLSISTHIHPFIFIP